MFPSALKRFRRHQLPVPTRGNVCCVLERSYGWVRSPIRCPDKRAILNCPVVAISFLCESLRSNAACAATQGRTTSGDSSGGENVSRPGSRSGEPCGFRSNAQVCKFQAADHSVNARVLSSRGFGNAAGFTMFQLWVQEGATSHLLPSLSCTLVM